MPESNTPVEEPVTTEQVVENPTPTEDKSRTQEQFEKLKESNQELKAERDQFKEEATQYKSVLESLNPTPQDTPQPQAPTPSANQYSHLNQQQVDSVYSSMIDENGYLDGNKLVQTLQDMNNRAVQAEQRAARVEEHLKRREVAETESIKSQTVKEVHAKYPEIDPESDRFDPELWELVQNEMIGQMMKGEEDFMTATEKWYSKRAMTRQEKQQAEQSENAKLQINSVRPRSPMMNGYYEREDQENLISQVRQGKKGAVAEALRRHEQALKRT